MTNRPFGASVDISEKYCIDNYGEKFFLQRKQILKRTTVIDAFELTMQSNGNFIKLLPGGKGNNTRFLCIWLKFKNIIGKIIIGYINKI